MEDYPCTWPGSARGRLSIIHQPRYGAALHVPGEIRSGRQHQLVMECDVEQGYGKVERKSDTLHWKLLSRGV